MRKITSLIITSLVAGTLTGCIVHDHRRGPGYASRREGCPPAHHWNGDRCVHNGNGEGNGKGRGNGRWK